MNGKCRACSRFDVSGKRIFCMACFSLLNREWKQRVVAATRRRFSTVDDIVTGEMAAAIIQDERRIRERLKTRLNGGNCRGRDQRKAV